MKNKSFYAVVLLVVFIVFGAGFELSAKVLGKIEGKVIDTSSGEPLPDVTVKLWFYLGNYGRDTTAVEETRTNSRGYFVFNRQSVGKYILSYSKKGYISFPRESYEFLAFSEKTDLFALKEGEIRFFYVKMKKGTLITGSLLVKDSDGVHPIPNTNVISKPNIHLSMGVTRDDGELYNSSDFIPFDRKFSDENGYFFFDGVEMGKKYKAVFECQGFGNGTYYFEVIDNRPLHISHVFDKTNPTKIFLKVLSNNKPANAGISLLNHKGYSEGTFVPSENGYILYDVPPTSYKILINLFDLHSDKVSKYMPIEIEEGISYSLEVKY